MTSDQPHAAVLGQVLADPAQVVVAHRCSGHDPEPLLAQPGDGEVALDPASPVQHLRVGDRPGRLADVVRTQVLQELESARTLDFELGEGALVEEAGALTGRACLGRDRRRPVLARPATRAQRLIAVLRVRLEPVGPLPARLLAEARAQLGQAAVGRREPQRTPRLPLEVGVLDVVVGGVDLGGALQGVALAAVLAAEAADVHVPEVEAGLTLDDPLCQLPAHPARPLPGRGRRTRRRPRTRARPTRRG